MGGNLNQSARDIIAANMGVMSIVSDRADAIFKVDADTIVSDLVYNAPAGDTSKEWEDFRDTYRETYTRTYIGEESLDVAAGIRREKHFRIHPVQQVIGPYQIDTLRVVPRYNRDKLSITEELADEAVAQANALERLWNKELRKMLVRGNNDGLGGLSPISEQPLFTGTFQQLRTTGTKSNLLTVTIPGSITNPNIVDAEKVMEDALERLLENDAGRNTFFVNREQARGSMVVLTSAPLWDKAFDDLQTRPTLAVNSSSAASERAALSNRYQNRFKLHNLGTEGGKAWAGKIRIFLTGPNPDDRPVRFKNDLGLQNYQLDGVMKTAVGSVWSYYLDAWKPETGVLVTPVNP